MATKEKTSKEKQQEFKHELQELDMTQLEAKIKNAQRELQIMQDAYFHAAKLSLKSTATKKSLEYNVKKLEQFHKSFVDNKGDFEKIKKELKNGGEKMKVLFELYQKAQYTPKELAERTKKRKNPEDDEDNEVTINKKKKPATPKTTTSTSTSSAAKKTPTTTTKSDKTPAASDKKGEKKPSTKKKVPPPPSSSDDE